MADPANKDRKEIKNLKMKCSNGCGIFVRLVERDRHLANECVNRRVVCPACGDEVIASALERHRATDCSANFYSCRLCGEKVRHDDTEKHFEASAGFVGKHMLAITALFDEVDRLRAKVDGEPAKKRARTAGSAVEAARWHPGKIRPQPGGVYREGGGHPDWQGYDFDHFASGWQEGLTLDRIYRTTGDFFNARGRAYWTCCGGIYSAPGCAVR